MRTRFALFALVPVLLLALSAAAQQTPAAYLARAQGEVRIERAGGGGGPAAAGARLVPGDRIVPAQGARAVLIMASGAHRVVSEPYTVPAPTEAGSADLFARTVATLAQASSTDARAAGGRVAAIRPIPGVPAVVAPLGRVVVTSTRPTFRWVAEAESAGFTVLVQPEGGTALRFEADDVSTRRESCRFYDAADELVEVSCLRSTWTLPQDAPPLTPGVSYTWRVVPTGGRASGGGRFRVAGPDEYGRLAQALDEISGIGLDPSGDGLFLAIPAYRELGLLYDALAAITALEGAGGISPDLYRLKAQILGDLGMEYEARLALRRAESGS